MIGGKIHKYWCKTMVFSQGNHLLYIYKVYFEFLITLMIRITMTFFEMIHSWKLLFLEVFSGYYWKFLWIFQVITVEIFWKTYSLTLKAGLAGLCSWTPFNCGPFMNKSILFSALGVNIKVICAKVPCSVEWAQSEASFWRFLGRVPNRADGYVSLGRV